MTLPDTLPDLELAMAGALLHIGRGDIVDQLRVASIERWEYDEFADVASIFVTPGDAPSAPRPGMRAETVSIYDEAGVIIETDKLGPVQAVRVRAGKELSPRPEGRPPPTAITRRPGRRTR